MKITKYNIFTDKKGIDIKIAVASDLHSKNYKKCIQRIKSISPDIILCPGDILERLDGKRDSDNTFGFEFLKECTSIAKTYYSFGNHELYGGSQDRKKFSDTNRCITKENADKLKGTGVTILDDDYILHQNMYIGGLSSGLVSEKKNVPNLSMLSEYSNLGGFKILLCHHPEYYETYIKDKDIDIILSGHAHGGQWRIFGRGVYAPCQGIFPKYTKGVFDNRHIICAGSANSVSPIPRLFNPTEVLSIRIKSR